MSLTTDHKVVQASLDALRELSLEQLQKERDNLSRHLQEAIVVAEMLVDFVIAEKQHQRTVN